MDKWWSLVRSAKAKLGGGDGEGLAQTAELSQAERARRRGHLSKGLAVGVGIGSDWDEGHIIHIQRREVESNK